MHKKRKIGHQGGISDTLTPAFARRAMETHVPKNEMPQGAPGAQAQEVGAQLQALSL